MLQFGFQISTQLKLVDLMNTLHHKVVGQEVLKNVLSLLDNDVKMNEELALLVVNPLIKRVLAQSVVLSFFFMD